MQEKVPFSLLGKSKEKLTFLCFMYIIWMISNFGKENNVKLLIVVDGKHIKNDFSQSVNDN